MYWVSPNSQVPLKDVRGKVVLIRDFPLENPEQELGIDWLKCDIQDEWKLASIQLKAKHCIDHFEKVSAIRRRALIFPSTLHQQTNNTAVHFNWLWATTLLIGVHCGKFCGTHCAS